MSLSSVGTVLRICGFCCLLLLVGCLGSPGFAAPFDPGSLEHRCPPCQDFDRFVNARWKQTHPLPANVVTWDRFEQSIEDNSRRLRKLMEQAAAHGGPAGQPTRLVGDFYASCMDKRQIDAGLQPLATLFAEIDAPGNLANQLARLHARGIDVLFAPVTYASGRNTPVRIEVGPTDLTMATGAYADREQRRRLAAHAERLLSLSGRPAPLARQEARTVVAIETILARLHSLHPAHLTLTADRLQALTPHFPWHTYLVRLGLSPHQPLRVFDPEFFRNLDRTLATVSEPDWRSYLRWRLLTATAPHLPAPLSTEYVRFSHQFWEPEYSGPRWRQCVQLVTEHLPQATAALFSAAYLHPGSRERVAVLVEALRTRLRHAFATGPYSEPTRREALAKLDALTTRIAVSPRWQDLPAPSVGRTALLTNILAAWHTGVIHDLGRIGQPPDPDDWQLDPQDVNAYYDLEANAILLPAGLLRAPFFDPEADDALNFGGLGAVLGHELTHGLGALEQYDARGSHRSWWLPEDRRRFARRTACIARQLVRVGVDSRSALAESVADVGGLQLAFAAFTDWRQHHPQPATLDHFTPEQRFFLGYARIWAANEPYGSDIRYAPARLRVNLPLANLAVFARSFACRPRDPMVRFGSPCQVW